MSGGIDSGSIACNIPAKKNKFIHYYSALQKIRITMNQVLSKKLLKKKLNTPLLR